MQKNRGIHIYRGMNTKHKKEYNGAEVNSIGISIKTMRNKGTFM